MLIFILIQQFVYVNSYSFIGIGDWGGYQLGIEKQTNVLNLASQISKERDYFAVLNTGDNFYECGITSTNDSQITTNFINVFNPTKPWIGVLGNHDYGYNPQAQVDLTNSQQYWYIPKRYYKKNIDTIDLFMLDTSPCISDYRKNKMKHWNPCDKPSYKCKPLDLECKFHENILEQNCTKQFIWFESEISKSTAKWKVVVGHHRIDEINVEPFGNIVDEFASIYINGHKHQLNHYTYKNKSKYLTTGAGSMVLSDDNKTSPHHSYIWSAEVTGYTRHTFNETCILNEFLDVKGRVLYDFRL
jgi:tartrate-resistant acid phosphatase type 5